MLLCLYINNAGMVNYHDNNEPSMMVTSFTPRIREAPYEHLLTPALPY
jgi:hypothetical protein